ncbi:MAG: hypothetical protein ABIR56_06805 [Polaromonas sp.]
MARLRREAGYEKQLRAHGESVDHASLLWPLRLSPVQAILISTGEKIMRALHQLEQFMPGECMPNLAQNVLNGATVEPVPDPDDEGDSMLFVTFPGGKRMTVNGRLYLDLQILERARIEVDSEEGGTKVSLRYESLHIQMFFWATQAMGQLGMRKTWASSSKGHFRAPCANQSRMRHFPWVMRIWPAS